MQRVAALTGAGLVERKFPSPDSPVGDTHLLWGAAEEICSPAYWAAQAWMWEIDDPHHYRLGETFEEEVLACLLGGYGIPAEVGLAAYERLRTELQRCPLALTDSDHVYQLLREPLNVRGRLVRYRFARQKATYLAGTMSALSYVDTQADDRRLRDQLTELPGIGPKTASWIVRNLRGSDDVSILDVHVLRAGRILGIFPGRWTVHRHYRPLEDAYLTFARAIGVRASILDSVMWMTMRRLPAGLRGELIGGLRSA